MCENLLWALPIPLAFNPLDRFGNCLICLVLVNHDDCRIKFQNGIRDAKTRRVQIEDFLLSSNVHRGAPNCVKK